MLPPLPILNNPKAVIRERMKAERKSAVQSRPDAPVHAARNFLAAITFSPSDQVALYLPIRTELNTEPLALALIDAAIPICLPEIINKKKPLSFRRYLPGDHLVDGKFGTKQPAPPAQIVQPTIVVVPLLGFTRRGDRLGYGGGYYDRTLQSLRENGIVTAIGYGFGAQEVDALPVTALDQQLDWIVTERAAIRC